MYSYKYLDVLLQNRSNYYNLPHFINSWACLFFFVELKVWFFNDQYNVVLTNMVSHINKEDLPNPPPAILFR